MEELLEAQGDLGRFRTFQKQPAHREEPHEEQLRGFLWNRKLKYGELIVEALDVERMRRPLTGVLSHALRPRLEGFGLSHLNGRLHVPIVPTPLARHTWPERLPS
jgi:hypothetical protein